MIQINNTNTPQTLNLKFDESVEVSTELVQNGSFNEIDTTNLVLNPDFAQIGSDLVTNGDFSAAGSNLVSNPNFTETGSELVTDGDFSSGANWYEGTGCTISGNQGIFTAAPPGSGFTGNNLNAAICVVGKSYKVTYTIDSVTSGSVGLRHPFTGTYYDNTNSFPLDVTEYVVADDTNIYIQNSGITTATISNVSVKELGADWTTTTTLDGGIEFNAEGLKITNGALYGQAKVTQPSVFENGKSYKFSYTIVEYNGGDIGLDGEPLAMSRVVGDHVDYLTRSGDTVDFVLGKANDNTDVTVTNISVQELGEGWTLGTGWSIGEDKAVCDGSQTTYSGLIQNSVFTSTKSYKLTFDITSNQENFAFWVNGSQIIFTAALSDGSKEYYFTASASGSAYFEATTSFIGTITNITVQEVGQDWTFESGWGMGENKAIANTSGTQQLYQNIGLVNGKSYKITYKVADFVSGALYLSLNGNGFISPPSTSNDNSVVHYVTYSGSDGRVYFRGSPDVNCSITNIIVQQLDPNDAWNLNSNWVLTDNGAKSDGASNTDINQSKWLPELGETYKIEYTISLISQGEFKIKLGGVTTTPRGVAETYIEYVTAIDLSDGGGRLRIQIDNAAIGTISSISVYDIDGLVDIEFINQLTLKSFDFPNVPILSTNGRYSSLSITPPAETSPPSNATMEEGMYLVTFKLDQLDTVLATRLAFVGSVPAFKEATYDAYKVTDGTAYNVYVNG